MPPRARRRPAPTAKPISAHTRSPLLIRAAAIVLLLLGVVPMANLVTTGVGLPWYDLAMQQWLFFGAAVVALALLAGFFAAAPIDGIASRTTQFLLRPAPRVFALCIGLITAAAA